MVFLLAAVMPGRFFFTGTAIWHSLSQPETKADATARAGMAYHDPSVGFVVIIYNNCMGGYNIKY